MSNQKNLTTNDTWFFGHPKGMVTLFFTEMWERMSYYGMRALLVLYMTGAVTGFNPGLGWSQVDAQAIYGIYVGMVYFMVIPGGWLADNVLGHQKAVLIGAIIIALGHFTLAMPLTETFFLGLILVVLGTGLLKGNISTIVGQLYKPGDSRVQAGYTIFYMSINIGSTLGFLICSWLGEKIGWHWGFGAAGIGMFFGVLQYLNFRHLLGEAGNKPNDMPQAQRDIYIKWSKITSALMVVVIGLGLLGIITVEPKVFAENFAIFLTGVAFVYFSYLFLFAGLTQVEKKNLFLLLILFIGAAAFWSGFDQSASSLSIFALDIYLLGESKEYWIEVGVSDGPKIEEFDYDNTALDGLTITDITGFDFDSNSNEDIVFSAYDSEGNGKFVSVPKSGDGTNWAEVLTYDNIPLIKATENIVYDQDNDIDIFVMGDSNPTNGIDLSPTSTLKVYETGEVNILENELDITFINQATSALNDHIVLADFDQDFDGGDIFMSYEDYGDNTASFLIIEKQETTDEEDVTTYSYLAQNNQELGLLNVPDQHAFTILVDYNSDFDIDAIFGIKGELNNETNLKPLNFYIQTNQSN